MAPRLPRGPHLPREMLRPDVVAGVVLAAILVPQGIAYADLAGGVWSLGGRQNSAGTRSVVEPIRAGECQAPREP